jgi:hypothetical protein
MTPEEIDAATVALVARGADQATADRLHQALTDIRKFGAQMETGACTPQQVTVLCAKLEDAHGRMQAALTAVGINTDALIDPAAELHRRHHKLVQFLVNGESGN